MKKSLFIISTFIGLLLFPTTASADSPITSTDFCSAYEDIAIVKDAGDEGIVKTDIAEYLADATNPIDVKAAVINALSWDIDGKTNADMYCQLVYSVSAKDLDMESLSGDQQFCIGYLMAMDDYFNTERALETLKLAQKNIPDSFTVSIVRALVESMDLSDGGWEQYIEPILQDTSLKKDMRPDAVNIILDYMALYSENSEIIVSQKDIKVEKDSSQSVYLYGTMTLFQGDEEPYQIVKGSDIADAEICKDDYGIYYLNITGTDIGSSSVEILNTEGKGVILQIEVIPKAKEVPTEDIPDTGVDSRGIVYIICIMISAFGVYLINTKISRNRSR